MISGSAASVFAGMSEMRGGIDRRTVKNLISDKIAALVSSGVLQVGDELPGERELAAALMVSRETVRGAVQALAARGILEVSHGSRTRVASNDLGMLDVPPSRLGPINAYDIEAVHGARLLVERTVVAEAARAIDAATIARLETSLAAQREALDDPVRFLIIDREFHTTIYRTAPNALLGDFVTDLYTYMLDHRRSAVARAGATALSYEDHVAIVAALRARDPDATMAAFDRHLQRIYATTRSVIDNLKTAGEGGHARSAAG